MAGIVFDPENVERKQMLWTLDGNEECVLATDYDKLLEMYREAEHKLRCIYGPDIASML